MHENLIGKARSINGVDIRLTFERWYHISEGHPELAGSAFEVLETINEPDLVVKGLEEELLALKKVDKKYLVAVYREVNKKDGFVITAFYTSKLKSLLKRRKIIWQRSTKK
jgi:hypothetical protein